MDLVASNLVFKPEEQYHLNDVSFSFNKGKLYTILGRTLSGKTTLLKTITGHIKPDSGKLLFEDQDFNAIPVWKRNIAMVYQQFINYPHLNVFENVAFPLRQRKIEKNKIIEKVNESLKTVGLSGFEKRKIHELSGGQQQRVALARSLVKNAKILLLDEPLVNMDYKLREQLREEFKKIFSTGLSEETILIYSTTDPHEAMGLDGEVIVLDEGKVLQTGYVKDIFENPVSLRVAEITNDPPMNIIPGFKEQETIKFEDVEIAIPESFSKLENNKYNFGIRASDVKLDNQGLKFEIELSEINGSETLLHLKRGDIRIIVLIGEVLDFKIHETVKTNFNKNKFYVFDQNGKLILSPYEKMNGKN